MPTLSRILLSSADPEALVKNLAATIEGHVAIKSGLGGMAMKIGLGALKAAKPDIAERATRNLLPHIATALEPLHSQFTTKGQGNFGDFLSQHAAQATQLVISAVDARIAASSNTMAQAVYKQFRGSTNNELKTLLPALGRVLNQHWPKTK